MQRRLAGWAIVFGLIAWASVLVVDITITLGLFAQCLFLAYLSETK